MVLPGVTEDNMIKNKLTNCYIRKAVILAVFAIMLLLLPAVLGSAIPVPGIPKAVYGLQIEIQNSKDIKWYDKALIINQNNVPALAQKGTDLVSKGNSQQAITWLDKALRIDPSNTVALLSKGAALRNLGQYQQAIVLYDRVLAIDPNDVYAIGGKADSLYGSGHYQQAVAWIEKALEIDPGNGNVLQVKEILTQATN
jgi:tetratricopeptide (TPR) repeat protein